MEGILLSRVKPAQPQVEAKIFLSIANPPFRRLLGGCTCVPMSGKSEMDIDYLAKLARLALTEEEKTKFSGQIDEILNYINKLKEVDVSGVEPMAHASPVFNVWQDDTARPGLTVEQALRNAPSQRQNMIVVPKVID